MRSTIDELVRAVGDDTLRSTPWIHAFVCYGCFLNLTLARGLAYGFEVQQAMDRIFRNPGHLVYMFAVHCAKCNATMACLGAK